MKIELLYFDGCPGYKATMQLLDLILREEGIDILIDLIEVTSVEMAKQRKFLGSPSIRIDGQDIEKDARNLNDYGLKCRIYMDGGKLGGVPPEKIIREAIKNAL